MDSQSSNIWQAVNRQILAGLPLPNRAASSLAPGVVMIDTGTETVENYPVFSVAGGRCAQAEFHALNSTYSGATFTVVTTANTRNAFPAGSLRPNLLRDPSPSTMQSITHWFDTGAFAAPPVFTFGNSPRSGLRGPSLITTDVRVEKSFRSRNEPWLDVRRDLYNLFKAGRVSF